MMISERIQSLIHKTEMEAGGRWLNYLALLLAVAALAVWYDTHCYVGFSAPEAMDAAQLGRNLSEGKGFTTEFIRPFSMHLLQKHNGSQAASRAAGANAADSAEVYGRHPDLANPPLYPLALAGLFKLTSPGWNVELHKEFWGDSGRYLRYKPEFIITVFNQLLLLAAIWLTFLVAKTIFDAPAAWLAAAFMLASDQLWKFSESGLPVLLLLVIFLGLVWCLISFEALSRREKPEPRRRFMLAAAAGLLSGLGMLTHYSFGWVIVPVIIFLVLFGGDRWTGLGLTAFLTLAIIVSPWIARNLEVSGTFFGTAGYALLENSMYFSGSHLMQSLNPELGESFRHIVYVMLVKLESNLPDLMMNVVPRLGGGWMGILFLAGLLLGLRNIGARRLRYFTMICAGVFLIFSALGRTQWSLLAPELNTENLLVLLTPLAVIFGVAFFVTLLVQMDVPTPGIRYAVVAVVVVLVRLPFILTLLPPKTSPVAYPPYYPPDIQKISSWMQPNELMMSDIPWAVAWYGDQQCTWTTFNCQYEFVALNDFIKPVNGLYLTLYTLDARFLSECVQGGVDNWGNFVYKTVAYNQLPAKFPLSKSPFEALRSGLFLSDRQRW
jgi:hypothetical protein